MFLSGSCPDSKYTRCKIAPTPAPTLAPTAAPAAKTCTSKTFAAKKKLINGACNYCCGGGLYAVYCTPTSDKC